MCFFPKDTKFALNSICKWLLKASATDKETCYIYTKYKVKFYLLCRVLPLIFINSDFCRGCFVCFSFASGDQCWESLSHGWFPLLSGPTPSLCEEEPRQRLQSFSRQVGSADWVLWGGTALQNILQMCCATALSTASRGSCSLLP